MFEFLEILKDYVLFMQMGTITSANRYGFNFNGSFINYY